MPAGRRPKANPEDVATVIVALRVTPAERELLDELVTARARELADEGVPVTLTSYLRSLIRREAKERGLLPSTTANPAKKKPPNVSRTKGTGQR
jgi:hypothetical protein